MTLRVIGCGAGRTGTTSLAQLLHAQECGPVTHERLLGAVCWQEDEEIAFEEARAGRCDVAFYWLWYAPIFLAAGYRVLYIDRDQADTARSWDRLTERTGRDPWRPGKGEPGPYDGCFPRFWEAETKLEAIWLYLDAVHRRSEHLERNCEGFHRIQVGDLNTAEGVEKILDAAGVPRARQRVLVGIHANQGPTEETWASILARSS